MNQAMEKTLMIRITVYLLLFCLLPLTSFAEIKCLETDGEAAVVNGDIPSAKMEAISRAKWAAIEQAVGVEVKAQTIVQNLMLVDDAISKQTKGIVSGYRVLQVKNGQGVVSVKVNTCVEPVRAKDAVAGLALNNSIAVFIPAKNPKVLNEYEIVSNTHRRRYEQNAVQTTDEHEEANILSETVIGKLAEQGYTVVDVAPKNVIDASSIERAMKNGDYMTLRSLMYKFLTNIILIGKTDYTVSTRKGEEIGNGIAMPFNHVTVRLTYRIVTRDPAGKMVILGAGTENGKGLANSLEDAAAEGLRDLSDNFVPVILEKIGKYIKGVGKKVEVKVAGLSEVSDNFAVKDVLQNIAWVTDVEEKGIGEFKVGYSENPLYLANSLSQKGKFKVENFSPYSISLKYLQ
jgi:hypothetical protein